jgi:Protein of unknown function (DUF3043)
MSVFRRRASDAPDVLDPDSAAEPGAGSDPDAPVRPGSGPRGNTPAKGKPTPKRSEAERRRRQPYPAPTDQKAASQQGRTQDKVSRQRKMEAMRRGEDWALPRKDQGPVRALARDVVDSRRGLSEYYLYGIFVLVLLLFLPQLRGNPLIDYVILVVLVVVVGEGWFVGRKVAALAQQRFPGQTTRGVKLYAAMRGTQIRKMRVPAPRVNRGDEI